jgi:Uma2 family endonuclease
MSATLTPEKTAEAEQRLVLNGISWRQYEAILSALPEQAGLRMIYFGRRLTLLSPSYRHDWIAEACGDLVKAVAQALGLAWEQSGHTTYRLKKGDAGVEGDKAFYFGEHAKRMIGAREIDLTTQPPPDLTIEIEVSHSANDAMAAWGRIGVPEVWRLDTKRWTLTFGTRNDDGIYSPSPRSAALPVLEPNDVLNQLRLAEKLGSSRWHAQLSKWIKSVLLPRRGH